MESFPSLKRKFYTWLEGGCGSRGRIRAVDHSNRQQTRGFGSSAHPMVCLGDHISHGQLDGGGLHISKKERGRSRYVLPTSNAKRTTPVLQTSIGSARYGFPKANSGAAYGGLPHASPSGRSWPLYLKTLHRPKSDILRLPVQFVERIRKCQYAGDSNLSTDGRLWETVRTIAVKQNVFWLHITMAYPDAVNVHLQEK
jgi:hypothetical protein